MLPVIALVPAKGASRRVENKNTRPFYAGRSLLEWKLDALRRCSDVAQVFVSSEESGTLDLARSCGAEPMARDPRLSADDTPIGEVIAGVLRQLLAHTGLPDATVYWAHPTAPFVRPETVAQAIAMASAYPDSCVVGVERLQDFFWTESGPLNYCPEEQPRSQELPPLFRVAGGIHIGSAVQMITHRSHTFAPRRFIELDRTEALDINSPYDWRLCALLAPSLLPYQ